MLNSKERVIKFKEIIYEDSISVVLSTCSNKLVKSLRSWMHCIMDNWAKK